MLQELIEYAHKHSLSTEAGFASRNAQWAVRIDKNGRCLGVLYRGEGEGSKRYGGRTFLRAPNLTHPELTGEGGGRSHFLIDSIDTVFCDQLGIDKESKRRRHEFFLQLHQDAAEDVPELVPVVAFLRDENQRARAFEQLQDEKAKPSDKLTFAVEGADPPYVPDWTCWHDWWREFRRENLPANKADSELVCLATGEVVHPALTHNKVRHLNSVGGLSTGDALVSFKYDPYQSYGFKQSENGAVDESAMVAYTEALNDLLANSSEHLAGARVAYWFKKSVSKENNLLFGFFGDETERQTAVNNARELLRAVREGRRPEALDNEFYALSLSANSGRVVIRDWMQGSFEQLAENVDAWFSDLDLVAFGGRGSVHHARLGQYVESLLPPLKRGQDRMKWLAAVSGERSALWRAAVEGRPLPASAARRILSLNQTFVQTSALEEARRTGRLAQAIALIQRRMSLLRAYINRAIEFERLTDNRKERNMSQNLNPNHPEPAYHFGRLMAVYSRIQDASASQGGASRDDGANAGDARAVKASVVNRFFTAAVSTPRTTLSRLDRLSQHHLAKLKRDAGGLASWFESLLVDIWDGVQEPPEHFDTEKEIFFHLGYYHQLAAMRRRKETSDDEDSLKHTTEREDDNDG
ncbi:MAG: hypothetical protein MAG453_02057 [Calditrichaeota bacterium]|nr:hypothetical protein [Calditrichota bacterium]